MLTHEGHELERAIVSTPGDAYLDRTKHADANIPELASDPNSIFTRDVALCTPRGHIKMWMGLADRRDEARWMAEALDALDEPCVGALTPPGTVEGGDVICLRDNEVIANVAENEDAIWDLVRAGVHVHSLDLSEFRKGAGGPTCLILPVERG
jgi:N-dimethylarginine dimethylaminohydrolase